MPTLPQFQKKRPNPILMTKKVITSVILIDPEVYDQKTHLFYCSYCGKPTMSYVGEILSMIPGDIPMKLPLTVQCSNEYCKAKYRFSYFVEVE